MKERRLQPHAFTAFSPWPRPEAVESLPQEPLSPSPCRHSPETPPPVFGWFFLRLFGIARKSEMPAILPTHLQVAAEGHIE